MEPSNDDSGLSLDTPPADEPTPDAPADNGSTPPAPDQNADQSGNSGNKKSVEQLTGKLGQEIRNLPQNEVDGKFVKYILNSIISACNMSLLSPEDKAEIQKKFDSQEAQEVTPEPAPAEQPMAELAPTQDTLPVDTVKSEPQGDLHLLQYEVVMQLVQAAKLVNSLKQHPDVLCKSIADGISHFVDAHRDGSQFIMNLARILKSSTYKPRGIYDYNDLDPTAQQIYNALIKKEEETADRTGQYSLSEMQKKVLMKNLHHL